MTKRNLTIIIILLSIMDLVAASWYMSRRIETAGNMGKVFDQRDTTEAIIEADTVTTASQPDVFDDMQFNTYYFTSNTPAIKDDHNTYYTSIKHVKVIWPVKVNGDSEFTNLNKELIKNAFDNSQTKMKDARYVYLNSPNFNRPIGDDYRTLVKAPKICPVYGNVSQVLVYPYMTSDRLLVMKIDKVEYNGSTTTENTTHVHYDRFKQRVLSRLDILVADVDKENKLLKVINKKIDEMNRRRGDDNQLQHALNVPNEICCNKNGIMFDFKLGSIYNQPIDITIGYDQLEPFFTEEFKQLQHHNKGYKMFDNNLKPEPINASQAPMATATTTLPTTAATNVSKPAAKQHVKSNYYNNDSSKKNSWSKPKRTSRKKYSGAKRRSGYHGYSGRRHWSHRRR